MIARTISKSMAHQLWENRPVWAGLGVSSEGQAHTALRQLPCRNSPASPYKAFTAIWQTAAFSLS